MKIVYIYRSLAVTGGLEKILIDKMNYLASLPNYEITVITYEQGNHPIVFPLSSAVKHIDMGILFYTCYRYGIVKRTLMQISLKKRFRQALEQQINRIQPDIICCTSYSNFEVETICQLPDHSKKIIESHSARNAIGKRNAHKGNPIMEMISGFVDRKFYRSISRCAAFVTLTQADALAWKNVKDAIVIPNMIPYIPDKEKNIQIVNKKVIGVGRLTTQKGFDLLIDSWNIVAQKHPDWVLDIYGDGDDHDKLICKTEELGLEKNIHIHPSTNLIYDKYMECDLYVMSSRWEGFGLVLVEAMSCGVPCISFDCPYGPSDIIADHEDGLLVENGNIQQLADKICFLIENENIRLEMGRKARENAKRYLPENIIKQWEELFESLLKQ